MLVQNEVFFTMKHVEKEPVREKSRWAWTKKTSRISDVEIERNILTVKVVDMVPIREVAPYGVAE